MKLITDRILLAHGSGGRLTHELISKLFRSRFSNPMLNTLDDSAVFPMKAAGSLAFTTDSFVVNPLFFPGGDIGKLSVFGTVNDLAMKGARPLCLSVAAIIEEGLETKILEQIADSISKAAKKAGVPVVTGDTKVVERGKADKLFLTTSGIGIVKPGVNVSGSRARPGDAVLINGTIADHGVAVLAARNEFKLKTAVKSDCAPLNALVQRILSAVKEVHTFRDPTRGGLATTLNEIADSSNVGIIIEESRIPVKKEARSACALLGLDPLYVANEGKVAVFVPEKQSAKTLQVMKKDELGKSSARIGTVVKSPKGVWLKTTASGLRPLVMLEGEQMPRIC